MGKLDKKTIGGYVTHSAEFPCMQSAEYLIDLMKVVLPGLTYLFESGVKIDSVEDIMKAELSLISSVVVNMLMHTTGKEARRLAILILSNTSVEYKGKHIELNTEQDIDTVFDGRMTDMLSTLGLAIEVSFLGFFQEKYKELKEETGKDEKDQPANQSN